MLKVELALRDWLGGYDMARDVLLNSLGGTNLHVIGVETVHRVVRHGVCQCLLGSTLIWVGMTVVRSGGRGRGREDQR